MAEYTLQPHQIAQELNLTSNTVRNWIKRYSEHFSASAQPDSGEERAITQQDRQVLSFIAASLNHGMKHEQIAERLAETTITELEYIEPAPQPTRAPQPASAPMASPETTAALSAHIAGQQQALSADMALILHTLEQHTGHTEHLASQLQAQAGEQRSVAELVTALQARLESVERQRLTQRISLGSFLMGTGLGALLMLGAFLISLWLLNG